MINFRLEKMGATMAIVAMTSFAAHADEARVSISGGTRVTSIPQGTSGNSVLDQAGIEFAGGEIWVDGTLDNLSDVALTLYDVGSESHWTSEIRLGNTSGAPLLDRDDHYRGSIGDFTNGPPPFQRAGSVVQNSGLADFEFWRVNPDPDYQTVVNGQSPMMMVPDYGYASIAFAYLNDSNQIVSDPTNRILVLLEDGGADRDYDDYVGILEAAPVSSTLLEYTISADVLEFNDVPVNTTSTVKIVTITNTGNVTFSIASIRIGGTNPKQFAQTNNCPSNVSPGSNCTISVLFKPTSTDAKKAKLKFDVAGALTIVELIGNSGTSSDPDPDPDPGPGPIPEYTVSSTMLDFGNVAAGSISAAQTATITNTGAGSLSVARIRIGGTNPKQFAQTSNCSSNIATGSSCTINVVFKPTSTGPMKAKLKFEVAGTLIIVDTFGTGSN